MLKEPSLVLYVNAEVHFFLGFCTSGMYLYRLTITNTSYTETTS